MLCVTHSIIRNALLTHQYIRSIYQSSSMSIKFSTPEAINQSVSESSSSPSSKETLALPPTSTPTPETSETTQLDMSSGSASIMLDHLGPMVVGVDGSLSRISNFEKLSELEKKNTLRIIGKRNKERLDALKNKEGSVKETM